MDRELTGILVTATVSFGMPENLRLDWNLPGIFYDPGIFREFDNFSLVLRPGSGNFLGNLTTFSWSYDPDPGIFREFDNFS